MLAKSGGDCRNSGAVLSNLEPYRVIVKDAENKSYNNKSLAFQAYLY